MAVYRYASGNYFNLAETPKSILREKKLRTEIEGDPMMQRGR
jgi:hypothetical protein